jgi:alpha-L-rhamnosidase
MQRADSFLSDAPIWAHAGKPAGHEVALFRHTFTLDEPLAAPTLALFADTRYEVWVDGAWVGRGPARFSRRMREYDVLPLDALAAGPHLVAVLVQWAPNTRRSESTAPFLQGHIQGRSQRGEVVVARTGPGWVSQLSPAWRADAAPVHAWGLIGPTELLDFRALPSDWAQPTFADGDWPGAAVAEPQPVGYQPRSIPLLANVPIAAVVREVGLLAPGYALAELPPQPASIAFRAQARTTLTIETLAMPELATTRPIKIDGAPLVWSERAGRPDVVFASRELAPGAHRLQFVDPPAPGLTYSVSTAKIAGLTQPLQQGASAGRRLLLAEPISQTTAVAVSTGDGIGLSFAEQPAYAVLDLGRVVHGRVVASVAGPAGTIVDIGWDERLWQGARPLPYPGSLHPEWNQADSWALDGGERALTNIDARSGRYLLIAAWGPARLSGLRVYEERYPAEQRGSFSSSDPLLDRIWKVGVDTLRPNMTDAYADPWRERGQWWGDAYVDDHVNQGAFGDTDLLRRGLRLMAEGTVGGSPAAFSPHGGNSYLLDYGMLWIQRARQYLTRTGGAALPDQVYPAIRAFMGYLQQRENTATGLLDIPYGGWWETALIDWPADTSRYGQSTALNALYYATLRDAADIADALGQASQASAWRARAAALKPKINAALFLAGQGRYLAGISSSRPRAFSTP